MTLHIYIKKCCGIAKGKTGRAVKLRSFNSEVWIPNLKDVVITVMCTRSSLLDLSWLHFCIKYK